MNIYLLKIFSFRLLSEEINKITSGKNNIIFLNYDDVNIDEVINECNYFSLLNEEKIVIVRNFKMNNDSKKIEKYFDNPNPNTTLVLITDNIDKRNSTYKKIKVQGKIIEISELKSNEIVNKINNYCKKNNIIIDYNAVHKLLEYNIENYDLVLNEIDKISLSTNNITVREVELYSSKLAGEDTFELCDAITSKNYKKIPELLNNFIIERKEVVPFVSLLANQYRIIYATIELKKSNESIGEFLNIHPYRVKLAKEKSYLYTKTEINNLLLKLCDLDKELKSLNIDQYILLKKFILSI